jgi:ubiquinone/menaquinone biosynthesis C-methylase UbiE
VDRALTLRLLAYFDEAASDYATAIEPALRPLAVELVDYAALRPGERVVDLGAGTGLAAREAVRRGGLPVAVDLSHKMTLAARQHGLEHVVQADMHALSLPSSTFDAALAHFALNSTDPRTSLREARRVLLPGGRLAMQEWGTTDPLSDLFDDMLAEYAVDDPPTPLAKRRREQIEPHPWDDLETSGDIEDALIKAGFRDVRIDIATPAVDLAGPEAFIRYKLAWPIRRAEVDAMPGDVRSLFIGELVEVLEDRTGPEGGLRWELNVVRAIAYK